MTVCISLLPLSLHKDSSLGRCPDLSANLTASSVYTGLGWVAVGVSGTAHLRVWAPPGIAITTRSALIPDFNTQLERPGLGLRDKPKAGKQLLQPA